jgi:GR25 family glycosyltransferase involved in LPS biosynthesis
MEPTPTAVPNFTANPVRRQLTHRVFITGMCGRPKNSKRELAVTVSHMLAMREAMRDKRKKYALILEDDMKIVFSAMNWTSLIESAPEDFAVLQLITSNGDYVQKLWNQYTLGMMLYSIIKFCI